MSEPSAVSERRTHFLQVVDERFEDYGKDTPRWQLLVRDLLAALVVSLVAIPLGIGFSIASGMRPEQGIIAGAIAGILGGVFGGSKYQVYGPTAAFITIVAGIVGKFNPEFLILATMIAGAVILVLGLFRLGRLFAFVPHSIIVGFTMGIAATIIITQMPDVLGALQLKGVHHTVDKLRILPDLFADGNGHTLVLAIMTFFLIRMFYKISVFIPGPLIAMAVGTWVANAVWHENPIPLVSTKYGHLSQDMFRFTPPSLGNFAVSDLFLPVLAIVFIAALESLLSARMADRLANNPTPYNPDKELFGQGVVNLVVPLLNGFPCTGALARTATSIRVGAVSPLASILIGCSILILMVFFAHYLSMMPMACVGGLLIYVAFNMVKPQEVRDIWQLGWFQRFLMLYTAVMTVATDLMVAVASASVIAFLAHRMFPPTDKAPPLHLPDEHHAEPAPEPVSHSAH